MFSLRSYLASVFAVLVISSCASRPELVPVLKPELGQMSAEVELNGVLLMAEIDSDAEALSAYGFLYGKSETSMKKVQGQLNDGVLSVKLDGLEYDTDYFYKVFVSNGHSQIYSEILKFRTSEEPYLTLSETSVTVSSEGGIFYVDVSANIDFDIMIPDDEWVRYVCDENRVTFTVSENPAISRECEVVFANDVHRVMATLKITQEEESADKTLDIQLPFTEKNLGPDSKSFDIEVSGNDDFEVILPSDVDWLELERHDRKCTFTLQDNNTSQSRSCIVSFKALNCDVVLTLAISQKAGSGTGIVSSSDIRIPSDASEFSVVVEDVDMFTSRSVIPEEIDWVEYWCGVDAKYIFSVQENMTFEPRTTEILIVDAKGSAHKIFLIQEGRSSTFEIPFLEKILYCQETEFELEVGGDAEFEVLVPDNVNWVKVTREGRVCRFYISRNDTLSDRGTYIEFRSIVDNKVESMYLQQIRGNDRPIELPYLQKEVSCVQTRVQIPVSVRSVKDFYIHPDAADWILQRSWDITNYDPEIAMYVFDIAENQTLEERSGIIVFRDFLDREFHLTIVQNVYDGIIRFEDPEMKQACVGLFDIDADGELSYFEASIVEGIDGLQLDGRNIKSFNEFEWFLGVKIIGTDVFAGTPIESIRFHNEFTTLGGGAFMNCSKLKDIDMQYITIKENAFIGCTSLRNIDTFIFGERAFEGCTGIETVIQRDRGVPSYSMKNCTSLKTFEFRQGHVGNHDADIGLEAFYGCAELSEIIIPEYITEIHDRAFYGCSSLVSVTLTAKIPPVLGKDVFSGVSPGFKIYVHPAFVSTYRNLWPFYADCITAFEL